MATIVSINGSYRQNGITDQVLSIMEQTLQRSKVRVETIYLRNFDIEFCLNCRNCTQEPGRTPGVCVHNDGMKELIEKIEAADGYIFASPTNFGSVTALYKRFLERLTPYAYWPWGELSPKYRKNGGSGKRAVLVSSSAAPWIIGYYFYNTLSALKMSAKIVGADTVGTIFTGKASLHEHPILPKKSASRAEKLAKKLVLA